MEQPGRTAKKPAAGPIVINSDELTFVGGMRGTGKTTFTRTIVSGFVAEGVYVYAYDLTGEWDGVCENTRALYPSQTEWARLAQMAWTRGNTVLVCDEAEPVMGQDVKMDEYTKRIIWSGRHRGCGIVANTRRVAAMSKEFFEACQHIVIYRSNMTTTTRRTFRDLFGPDQMDKVNMINRLAPFHFLYYGNGQVKLCGPVSA